jgi:AraC-like DNA-binding protein
MKEPTGMYFSPPDSESGSLCPVPYKHETIKVPEGLLTWVYLHAENDIRTVPMHWHRSLEITLILKGEYGYVINRRRLVARADDLIIINGGALHSCELVGGASADALSIIFPYEFLQRAYKEIDSASFSVGHASTPEVKQLKAELRRVSRIFKSRKETAFYQLELNGAAYRILHLLLSHFMRQTSAHIAIGSQRHWDRCKSLIAYIDMHYTEPLSLKTIAEGNGITKEHLARLFKENLGTTVKKYITSLRIYHAHQAIIQTDSSELQIALDCGFPDSKSFIRAFKQGYGVTPLKYRKAQDVSDFGHRRTVLDFSEISRPPA